MGLGNTTQNDLIDQLVEELDGEVSRPDIRKVMNALPEAVGEILSDGYSVNIAGIVKLDPVGRPARTVEVFREFGNPESGKVKKKKPADLRLKARVLKKGKDALPATTSKIGKELIRG